MSAFKKLVVIEHRIGDECTPPYLQEMILKIVRLPRKKPSKGAAEGQ